MTNLATARASQSLQPAGLTRAVLAARSLWQRYRQARRMKATVFALRALDDRTLHDIGLDRSEIEPAALGRHHCRLPRDFRHEMPPTD